jgi:hypothetical protein
MDPNERGMIENLDMMSDNHPNPASSRRSGQRNTPDSLGNQAIGFFEEPDNSRTTSNMNSDQAQHANI